jgi:hypothetical protein
MSPYELGIDVLTLSSRNFRPPSRPWQQARYAAFEAGEDKTGHIQENANQAIFYFDSKAMKGIGESQH